MHHSDIRGLFCGVLAVLFLFSIPLAATAQQAQATGTIRGVVTLAESEPLPGALVLLTDVGTSVRTNDAGAYEMVGVAPGTYTIVVSRQGVGSNRATVVVVAGQVTELDLNVQLQGRTEAVTVTASATGETTAFDTFNAVSSLDSVSMSEDMSGTLGEVLQNEPGLSKRGSGSGAARPMIRGFDGDRVLILDNGIRTGDLSSQSGDHGVSIEPGNVDRVEVVRGPATLLYGSSAIGGVVNAVSPDETFRTTPHDGLQVNGTADGGSANDQLGGNLNFIYADQKWMVYGGGGSRKSGDYDTPIGPVVNSQTDLSNGRGGFGYFGDKLFLSAGYKIEDGAYGVPVVDAINDPTQIIVGDPGNTIPEEDERVDLDQRRQSLRFDFGANNLTDRFVESFRVVVNAIDWNHQEIENIGDESVLGTEFNNRTYVARSEFEQHSAGNLHGKFGAWYMNRNYIATGEEALAPPVVQNALAGFVYEELDFERVRLQFGSRLEYNGYVPDTSADSGEEDLDITTGDAPTPPDVEDRSFTGVSGSIGARVDIGAHSAFVANLTSAYRAPALEELYNFGPHVGNLTFEVGNPNLMRERSNGVDLSLRRDGSAVQTSVNFFYYAISDFIYLDLQDAFIDGLQVGLYTQSDSRFMGVDGSLRARLNRYLIVEGGLGWVDAQLTDGTPLPRIPPLHGRIQVEVPYRRFRIQPEVIVAAAQDSVYIGEAPTAGYTVLNLGGSYTMVTGRAAHIFSLRGYNLTNELYYNHTSFIDVPEIGRGLKFGYALRLF